MVRGVLSEERQEDGHGVLDMWSHVVYRLLRFLPQE